MLDYYQILGKVFSLGQFDATPFEIISKNVEFT